VVPQHTKLDNDIGYKMSHRRRKVAAAVTLLMITIALFGNSKLYYYSTHRNLTDRPVMNTFFNVTSELELEEAHVLGIWSEEWTNVGFDTKLLTLEDAKRHPEFDEMEKIIEAHVAGDYAHSLYRWLAIKASGGGWISTYDTLPTSFSLSDGVVLPNDGTLPSFQAYGPTLVSGTVEEYEIVIKLMLDVILKDPGEAKPDEYALKIMQQEGDHNIHFNTTQNYVQQGFAYDSPRQVNCDIMSKVRAFHIPPTLVKDAMVNGLYPVELSEPIDSAHRAKAYRMFLEDWRSQCEDP